MYIALIILHVVLCLVLIVTILLQAGRGGGLTEMFGGDTAQSMLGTQAPVLLKKITKVCAVGFIITSLVLGIVTARRGRSLFEGPIRPHIPAAEGPMMPFTGIPADPADFDDADIPPARPIEIDVPGVPARTIPDEPLDDLDIIEDTYLPEDMPEYLDEEYDDRFPEDEL